MTFDVAGTFAIEFGFAIQGAVDKSGFPVDEWFWAGRTKPADAIEQWYQRGPDCVQAFIDWYEASDYEIWIAPDGRPAIELELKVNFGGIEVIQYVDLILVNSLGLLVIDTKSGSTGYDAMKRIRARQQPGFYACGVELAYGPEYRPLYGAHFMARGFGPKNGPKRYLQDPVPLTGYEHSVEFWANELRMMNEAAERGLFTASVGEQCERCGVAPGCLAVGGQEAAKYDPAHPLYVPMIVTS